MLLGKKTKWKIEIEIGKIIDLINQLIELINLTCAVGFLFKFNSLFACFST